MTLRWTDEESKRGGFFEFPKNRLALPAADDIITDRLRLRPLHLDDAAEISRLMSDEEISRQTVSTRFPFDETEARLWIQGVLDAFDRGEETALVIERVIDGQLLGSVSLLCRMTLFRRYGVLGYWVGRPYWGEGYGLEAVDAFVNRMVGDLKLKRIDARVFEDNMASRRVLEKVGFRRRRKVKFHNPPGGDRRRILYYRYVPR